MNAYMHVAMKEALKGISNNHGGPFGAVIVKDGDIIAKGHNQVVKNNDPTCHGEIDAIRKACKKLNTFDLSGCDIYTTSEPCPMCRAAIQWANINKVYYGCTVEDAESIGFRDVEFETSCTPSEQVDRDDCLEVFDIYSKIQNKTSY